MPEEIKAITDFKQLITSLKTKGISRKAAVVWPEESHTQDAIIQAVKEGFITPILICSETTGEKFIDNELFKVIIANSPEEAAAIAVRLVHSNEAAIIVKGLINTDVLLRAILDKEKGILPKGMLLTHIAVAKLPNYHKLLFFSDAAVIPNPTNEQRKEQIKYIIKLCHAFQIKTPKVSLIHCSEKVDGRHFPYTENYNSLKKEGENGLYGDCIIDGPLDLKTSCSLKAMNIKGITSSINGEADALIFPDIEAGNVFYKTITLFGNAETAAILQGTLVPVVLPSRGDTVDSKFYSLALASLITKE